MNFLKVAHHLINIDDVSGFSLKSRSGNDHSQLYNFMSNVDPFNLVLYDRKSTSHPTCNYVALVVTYKNYSNETILMTGADETSLKAVKSAWDNINNYIKLSLI